MYVYNPSFTCMSEHITAVSCSALLLWYCKLMLRRLNPIRFAVHWQHCHFVSTLQTAVFLLRGVPTYTPHIPVFFSSLFRINLHSTLSVICLHCTGLPRVKSGSSQHNFAVTLCETTYILYNNRGTFLRPVFQLTFAKIYIYIYNRLFSDCCRCLTTWKLKYTRI